MDNNNPKSRKDLITEKQNRHTSQVDKRSTAEILHIINDEDRTLPDKVANALPEIEKAIDLSVRALKNGHHVFYVGAGTSGRLGVLDASEIPPTFSAPRSWFHGIIAGGRDALIRSIEGAEDYPEHAIRDLQAAGVSEGDMVIGIASSSATPYVISALKYAHKISASTGYLICNPAPLIPVDVDVLISVDVGPEVITGSTRMKSGTATKMVLNMISTVSMIRLGKVYGNLMVDLQAVNQKLVDRGSRIIEQLTGLDYAQAKEALFAANRSVKNAIVMVKKECSLPEAKKLLRDHNFQLRAVVGDLDGM